jgi:chromosome segregation ATPase
MSKFSIVEPQSTVAAGKVNLHNWQHVLDAAIAVLREIDARYAHHRVRLEASAEDAQRKRRWLAQLEARRRKEREPYVSHVADIHQQRTFESMFRTMH